MSQFHLKHDSIVTVDDDSQALKVPHLSLPPTTTHDESKVIKGRIRIRVTIRVDVRVVSLVYS